MRLRVHTDCFMIMGGHGTAIKTACSSVSFDMPRILDHLLGGYQGMKEPLVMLVSCKQMVHFMKPQKDRVSFSLLVSPGL
ncbi:hypothetical protein GOP47_0023811 [Adiantum capillus-veneris]|uniref:Uncharacterized protein n=1 Tax=Adiantum capillus-veneris TaxID=13818 RepID=A0A9D4U6R2_ADICA|nr:hypothetical protein GOP47_0023811 [Adiantum capillus-veneris]